MREIVCTAYCVPYCVRPYVNVLCSLSVSLTPMIVSPSMHASMTACGGWSVPLGVVIRSPGCRLSTRAAAGVVSSVLDRGRVGGFPLGGRFS
jgi:hypothetical protein